jgi:hypothetical protein
LENAPLPSIGEGSRVNFNYILVPEELTSLYESMPYPWFDETQCSDVTNPFTHIGAIKDTITSDQQGFFEAFYEGEALLPAIQASLTIVGFRNFTVFDSIFAEFLDEDGNRIIEDSREVIGLTLYGSRLPSDGNNPELEVTNGQGNSDGICK